MPISLLLTIGLDIVILSIAAGLTASGRGIRPLMSGVGLALIPAGLYMTGLTRLVAQGIVGAVRWFQSTPWTTMTTWGVGLILGGLALLALGYFLPKAGSRETTKSPRAGKAKQRKTVAPPQAGRSAGQPQESDDEIEALLRKHNIT